ncbi:hypothetical protein CBS101457_005471 [Exobasidium rhododendri]|nr:hypothetical protein CBS101457_005471 [Exobasidium rhododendri]
MLSKGGAQVDDWVDSSVAAWIQSETRAMQAAWTHLPPSILFVHIPVHAMLASQNSMPYKAAVGGVFEEITDDPSEERTYPGLNADQPLSSQGGENAIPYSGQDRAFLDAFMQSAAGQARVHGIVSGHDHGNDWCAPSNVKTQAGQIVPLCFAKHSGFGGYDSILWNHGVRVLEFDLSTVASSVSTYIRSYTGEKRYSTSLSDAWSNLVPASTIAAPTSTRD